MVRNSVKHIRSAPYHLSSNGEAEHAVRTFKEAMKAKRYISGRLNQKLAALLLTYHTTPHTQTGATPSEIMFGPNLRVRIDLFKRNLHNRVTKQASAAARYHREPRVLSLGDRVLVQDYRKPKETWTDGVLVQKLGPVTYHVQVNSENNLIWKRHIDQIRQCSTDLDIKPVLESVDQGLCAAPPSVVHTENTSIHGGC